jgi:hypothetical protein
MQIQPQEIEAIEEAGMLDQSPVKLLRTKGGFWIAIGKPRGKFKEEALAAGSHPAIVRYNLQKQYPTFEPSMMKSELYADNAVVEKHSHFLSDELRKSGHDIFSVQTNNEIDFHITKQNADIAVVKGQIVDSSLVLKPFQGVKEFARALAGATIEKSTACGATKIKIEG